MNLSQLYYFRKLAELQHYTKAAKELFITQPTLSGSISSLEQELGVSLFQKAGRNVELTKYGAEFLKYVNASLEQLDKGIAIMKGYSGEGDGGVIDLGCIITLQTEFLPRLLNGYSSVNERKTEFNINQKPSQELLCGIVEGKHDVAFCAFDALYNDKLHQIPVAEQHLVVAMSPSSPLASKPYLTPGDLKGESLITYREEVPLGKSVKNLLDSFDVDDVRYVYEDESILAGFAANGSDLALMLDTFSLIRWKTLLLNLYTTMSWRSVDTVIRYTLFIVTRIIVRIVWSTLSNMCAGISSIDPPLRVFTSTRLRLFCLRVMFYRVGVREACETDRCEFGLRGGGLRNHAWFVSMAWIARSYCSHTVQ